MRIIFCLSIVLVSCVNTPVTDYSIEPFASKESGIVFDPLVFETYFLKISPMNMKQLEDNAKNTVEKYLPAFLKVGDYDIGKVGIRYKGNYTLWNCFDEHGNRLCSKLSLKIKFTEYDKNKQYYGLKRLNFHAMIHDPSMMKERLAYSIFREMGIITSRVTHAKLFINGEYMGIFALVEQIDGRFTDNRFPGNGDGNLYKATWPDTNDPWYYDWGLRTNKDSAPPEENNKKICEFYDELSSADNKTELINAIEKWWYVDELIKYFVVSDAINNWDGPTAYWCGDWNGTGELQCGNDNFYIYQEEKADKFHLLAWDLTTVFGTDFPLIELGIPLWYDEPEDCTNSSIYFIGDSSDNSGKVPDYMGAPNCDLFFQGLAAIKNHDGKYKGIYEKYARELLEGPFNLDNLYQKIDTWAAQISDSVKTDKYGPGFSAWKKGLQDLKDALAVLNQRLADSLE
jgi:spore coat protein H